ncbi:MAG: hypothetical protein PGN09_04195 [Sphingomonas fennica]
MSLFGSIAKLGGGILGQALSAKSNKKALAQAAAQQTAAINAASDLQRDQFNRTEGYLTPYMTAGTDALGGMRGLLGLNGSSAQETAIGGLRDSPMYQGLYDNGHRKNPCRACLILRDRRKRCFTARVANGARRTRPALA